MVFQPQNHQDLRLILHISETKRGGMGYRLLSSLSMGSGAGSEEEGRYSVMVHPGQITITISVHPASADGSVASSKNYLKAEEDT